MNRVELEQFVANYEPAPNVLRQLGNITLIMTVGPSGAGKTTLMRASGIPMAIPDAARLPRPGEQHGIDMWFRTEEEILNDARAGQLVQLAIGAGGDLKATRTSSLPRQGVAALTVVARGVNNVRALPFYATRTAIIVPNGFDAWMHQLASRGLREADSTKRMSEAKHSLEFALSDSEAVFVLNDNIPDGADRLTQVAAGRTPSRESVARAIAAQLLERLSITQ